MKVIENPRQLPGGSRLAGQTIVVKIGGSTLKEPACLSSALRDVAAMVESGARVALVHGGGPAITEAQIEAGQSVHFVEGLRVTDSNTIELAASVLDRINSRIVEELSSIGTDATSQSSSSQLLVGATRKLVHRPSGSQLDIGLVGEISFVDLEKLEEILEASVPVFAPVAREASGQLLNIDADNTAMALAVALGADKLIYITDVAGIQMEQDLVLPTLSIDQVGILIDSGIIWGGMIQKVRNCMAGIRKGIGSILICKVHQEGDLVGALVSPGSTGTAIIDEKQAVCA